MKLLRRRPAFRHRLEKARSLGRAARRQMPLKSLLVCVGAASVTTALAVPLTAADSGAGQAAYEGSKLSSWHISERESLDLADARNGRDAAATQRDQAREEASRGHERADSQAKSAAAQAKADEAKGHQVTIDGEPRVRGIDVSGWQPELNWEYWWQEGKRFASIKATEGTQPQDPMYKSHWKGAGRVGMFRTAYHFALPDESSGRVQARYFVKHGGGSKADGRTLPGVLDIEFGETVGKPRCWNMTADQLVSWVRDFLTTYEKLTGRKAIIYTNGFWWRECMNNSDAFRDHPLWMASYNETPGEKPGGWERLTFWQYTDTPLDQNYFMGSYRDLEKLARR